MHAEPRDHGATLELVERTDCEVGEGPFWDTRSEALLFVESFSGTLLRYAPATRTLHRYLIGRQMGAAIPRTRGGMVASSIDGLLAFDDDGGNVRVLVPVEHDRPNNRMNDAKCDSRGRLWVGTFSMGLERDAGTLYRIDPDHTVTAVCPGIHISNGLAWSPDETRLYFNDTAKRIIYVFDYDIDTGTASNRRELVRIDRLAGMPDGMCSDAEGCLWVALYGGGAVRRYSPQGEWIGVVTLPVKAVTSCAFGGPDGHDLYITTAWHEPAWVKPPSPRDLAGSLFRCRPGVTAPPAHRFGG